MRAQVYIFFGLRYKFDVTREFGFIQNGKTCKQLGFYHFHINHGQFINENCNSCKYC